MNLDSDLKKLMAKNNIKEVLNWGGDLDEISDFTL